MKGGAPWTEIENPGRGGRGFRGDEQGGKTRSSNQCLTAPLDDRPRLIDFPRQTGRLRRRDRFDQARIVVPDVADARADRPADHGVGRIGGQQRFQPRLVGRLLAEPFRPRLGREDRRHPVMQRGAQFVRLRGDDREAAHAFAGRRAPALP